MTNNQEWFNKKFLKDVDKIEIDCEDFEDSLIIEDYLNLEEINISDSEKIRKLMLKNLVNLKKCIVKGCEIEQIIIENCPNVESLNVYNNLLTNLEFVKNLSYLSSLEISMNKKISSGLEYLPDCLEKFSCKKTELAKILEIHNNDWKKYKQHLKEKGISEEESNRRELLSLREEKSKLDEKYNKLKGNVSDLVSLIEEKLNLLSNRISLNDPATKEIISNLREGINNITNENKKLKDDLEKFKPLFDDEEPILEGTKLGRGGFGEVYKGIWKTQFAAVKKPFVNTVDEKELAKIRKELKILKNLRSSYTIQYYGEYKKDNDIYLIMEYAEHGSLTKFITDNKDKGHNWQINYNFIKQMVKGLNYLHNEGIIHRDLKSSNVLITEGYIAKLSDFGLAKLTNNSNPTSSGKNFGTLRWVAPEILKEEKHSFCSDIYSFGMIMWEIATKCTVPFRNVDDNLVGFHISSGRKEIIPDDVPKDVCYIIEQCWKNEPNERITLKKILEIIGTDESELQTINDDNKLLNTENPQNSKEVTKNSAGSKDLGLDLDKLNLGKLDIQENSQEQVSNQLQLQISPK
jgi:hypothetical protein